MANPEVTRVPEPSYQHVLVPLDGSELADAAMPWAQPLAACFGADVQTISVADGDDETERLRLHVAELLGTDADDERIHVVVGGDPPAEIGRLSAELGSCLVCLSTRGRGRIGGAAVGSVARSLMLRTGEPVVAVGRSANRSASLTRRGPTAQTRDRIVACVDGQPPAESIVGVAAAWADALDMSLTVVTVAEPSPAPDRDDVPWRRSHGPSQDADAYMSELAARWDDVAPDMNAVAVYDPINPASGLQAWLKEHPAGLLAVTTHARSGLGRVVLGATAAAIVRVSPVPVLVVPLR